MTQSTLRGSITFLRTSYMAPRQPRRIAALVLTVATSLLMPLPTQAAIVANSIREFSGVQGQDSWFYGYYDSVFTPSYFQTMGTFSPASLPGAWVVDYEAPSPSYWTFLNMAGGHPNGTSTSGGRDAVEHWAVRRWVSEVDGLVTIRGNIADVHSGVGNGVVGHIFLGDREILAATVNEGNTGGINYSVTALVTVGTSIDFAIDPRSSHDLTDSTRFTAEITVAPEPSTFGITITAIGWLGFRFWGSRTRS